MKKSFTLAVLLVLTLASCNVQKKEETKTNTGKTEIHNISTQKNTNSGTTEDTGTGNLENNQKEQTMRKLQNGDVVAIMTTNKGKIELFLDTKNTPITTANFIGLAKKGYYNGVIFHRIIKDFMIQGGDPDGTGMGGKSLYGDKFVDEFSEEGKNNKFTISMANAGPNTNGSQFFINVNNNNYLDGKHSVFGEVVKGADNVTTISKVKTGANDKPEKEVKIISLEIKKYDNGRYVDYDFSEEQAKKDYKNYISDLEKKREKEAKEKAEAKKNMKVGSGSMVAINFTIYDEKGKKLESNTDHAPNPVKFQLGKGQFFPKVEDALVGMKIGDSKSLELESKDAFGDYSEESKQSFPLEAFDALKKQGIKIEVGAMVPTQFGEFPIVSMTDKEAIIDFNSPHAGKNIKVDFELKDID